MKLETTLGKLQILLALVAQNTLYLIFLRISKAPEHPKYSTGVALAFVEGIKLFVCAIVVFFTGDTNLKLAAWDPLMTTLHPRDLARRISLFTRRVAQTSGPMAIPALIYSVQNMLVMQSAKYLPTVLLTAANQTKIITTAFFSVTMLGRHLKRHQILAIPILVAGVFLLSLPNPKQMATATTTAAAALRQQQQQQERQSNLLAGLLLMGGGVMCSGFAGVYTEKLLKNTRGPGLWARNAQISFYGVLSALVWSIMGNKSGGGDHGSGIGDGGPGHLMYGFDLSVWLAVVLLAAGGLIVSLVMKYADNIVKGFSVGVSLCLLAVVSPIVFGDSFSFGNLIGIKLVISATFVYSGLTWRELTGGLKNHTTSTSSSGVPPHHPHLRVPLAHAKP